VWNNRVGFRGATFVALFALAILRKAIKATATAGTTATGE